MAKRKIRKPAKIAVLLRLDASERALLYRLALLEKLSQNDVLRRALRAYYAGYGSGLPRVKEPNAGTLRPLGALSSPSEHHRPRHDPKRPVSAD